MQACLLTLALFVAAQVGDERYGNLNSGTDGAETAAADNTYQADATADNGVDDAAAGTGAAADSAPAETSAAKDPFAGAPSAETPPLPSQIVVTTETPQPTLAETEPTGAASEASATSA